MVEWIQHNEPLLWSLAGVSVITFVGVVIAVPWLIIQVPTDYFAHAKRHRPLWAEQHPVVRAMLLFAKNLLGGLFILVGIAMLVLPGQGVLTILVGIMLLDFPGKYRFERRIVAWPPLLRTINRLRRRAGREPLVLG